jgi:signal-transduction protein with cAMP-binding, CBS, and nucleotidyltransferase domain
MLKITSSKISTLTNKFIPNALSIFNKSCYYKIDFKINQESLVKDVVARFTNFNIGCLAVTDKNDKIIGLVTERDYIHKVAFMNKKDNEVKIKEICTFGPDIIIAKKDDSLETCMKKIMLHDYRHLLVFDDKKNEIIGMISAKDLMKENNMNKNEIITRLSDFNMGKGGFFGSE